MILAWPLTPLGRSGMGFDFCVEVRASARTVYLNVTRKTLFRLPFVNRVFKQTNNWGCKKINTKRNCRKKKGVHCAFLCAPPLAARAKIWPHTKRRFTVVQYQKKGQK